MKDSETNNNLKVKKHWQLQVWANPSKHFKTPMNHNPAVVEFANIIWSPIMSDTNNLNKMPIIQNTPLHTLTGYTREPKHNYTFNSKTEILSGKHHLTLHASQLRQQLHLQQTLDSLMLQAMNSRHKKQTIYDNDDCNSNCVTMNSSTQNNA